ncbi:hypothetical protein L6452_08259 [Arctium lappa]|uniref:Uncharacterized protein n=1 Tax=Arctium lappa TaxID=4217 RepID=A0ACB9DHL4_ARCLA|nr:hypothetical protein L6452_08259 [Arctium lappa]
MDAMKVWRRWRYGIDEGKDAMKVYGLTSKRIRVLPPTSSTVRVRLHEFIVHEIRVRLHDSRAGSQVLFTLHSRISTLSKAESGMSVDLGICLIDLAFWVLANLESGISDRVLASENDDSVDMAELDNYLKEKLMPKDVDLDLLLWWKTNGGKYPTLQRMAKDILAIPVSTVASESAFSTSGRLISPHRSRLHPKTLEALMCAQSWLLNEIRETEAYCRSIEFDEDVEEGGTKESGTTSLDDLIPLQLLHMDLFGSVNIQSIAGKKYTLVIVDEYSRYTWVIFLRCKSDTPEELISFVKKMEVLNNLTVRSIRSDHGTEFKNSSLNNFFENKGISHNFSSVRTPQQNGVAKRRNRTIIEAARSMLSDSHLPTQFWAEAVNTSCFTQNRSLIVKRFGKTAYELFHGRKPSISFLHIFGCQCFILYNKDQLGKFDPKADDGIFLGYSSISKTYRVFNKRRQSVEETIHVTFDETRSANSKPIAENEELNAWMFSHYREAEPFFSNFQHSDPPVAENNPNIITPNAESNS